MRSLGKILMIGSITTLLWGCPSIPSFEDWVKPSIGQSINLIISIDNQKQSYAHRIGWKDRRYSLDNGNWVYVSPIRDDCFVHFEVDSRNTIIGYRTEGERCNF